MNKPEILQLGAYSERDEALLNEHFVMHRFFEVDDKAAFLNEHAANIKAIGTRGDLKVEGSLIESLPALEMIAVYGVGYDGVDMQTVKSKNLRMSNTPDVLTGDVADYAVAMMLAQSRDMVGASNWVRSSNWGNKGGYHLTSRAYGKRVGILGLGRIGFEIARRLAAFDMQINYSSRSAKAEAVDWNFIQDPLTLAEASDFLFVTLAANEETHHIVSKDVIAAMGNKGMIINVSRAANIDEDALLDALESGALGSAALDVFEGEPVINERFLALDNVLLQPHQGSGTVETREAMGDLVRNNLLAHFEGRDLLTPVN